jgi:hypothetical protein
MHSSKYQQNQPGDSTELMTTGVIVHDAKPEQKQSYLFWLRHCCTALMHHLLRGNEPCVWEKHNSAGEIYYLCYDPRTRRSVHCGTETEVRVWLDQLPYC